MILSCVAFNTVIVCRDAGITKTHRNTSQHQRRHQSPRRQWSTATTSIWAAEVWLGGLVAVMVRARACLWFQEVCSFWCCLFVVLRLVVVMFACVCFDMLSLRCSCECKALAFLLSHRITWQCDACGAVVPTRGGAPKLFCGGCGNCWNELSRPFGERSHGSVAYAEGACSRRAQDSSGCVTRAFTMPLRDPGIIRIRHRRATPLLTGR